MVNCGGSSFGFGLSCRQKYICSGVAIKKNGALGSVPCASRFLRNRAAHRSEVRCVLLTSTSSTGCPSRSYATKSISFVGNGICHATPTVWHVFAAGARRCSSPRAQRTGRRRRTAIGDAWPPPPRYLATAGTIQISAANPNSSATSPTPGSHIPSELLPGSSTATSGSAWK